MPHLYLSAHALDDGRHELRCKKHPRMKLGIFNSDDLRGPNEAWHQHMREFHAGSYERMHRHSGIIGIETEILNEPMPTVPTHLDTVDYIRATCSGMGCTWTSPNRYRYDDAEGRDMARAEADAHAIVASQPSAWDWEKGQHIPNSAEGGR